MHITKHELIERLGEPTEENVRPHLSEPGRPMNVLRWDCGCGATRLHDDPLWSWDPCERHEKERPVA